MITLKHKSILNLGLKTKDVRITWLEFYIFVSLKFSWLNTTTTVKFYETNLEVHINCCYCLFLVIDTSSILAVDV